MKIRILTAFISVCVSLPAFAGGIFYNSNQSAEYFRTYARNAATDNADIVYYNMSGTTKMKDGFYVNASNQIIFQEATVKAKNNPAAKTDTYTSDNTIWFVPNIYALYKKDRWAAFLGLETIGATAVREWKKGLPSLDMAGYKATGGLPSESYMKGESSYIALRIGGAYAVNEMFSFAVCGRTVYSEQNVEGYVNTVSGTRISTIDYTDDAMGYSGEFNIDIFPVKGMTIGLTYEMSTHLKFERNVHNGKNGAGLIIDGEKKRLDLPQVVRAGISYNITEAFRIEAGANAYLEKYANMSRLDDVSAGIEAEKAYGNTYDQSLCIEYTFSRYFLASCGICYNEIGQKKQYTLDTSAAGAHNDYLSFGAGGQFSPVENLKLNTSVSYVGFVKKYTNADANDKQVGAASKEYNKRYLNIGLGIEYKFF